MKNSELREFQTDFEKIKSDYIPEFKIIDNLRKRFVKNYSIENILKLSLDEYVVGKNDPTSFCNRIENELNSWGNIHGSTAKKFGIYFGTLGSDKARKYRIGKRGFGSNVREAHKNILVSIVELLETKDNLKTIKSNLISPMFKGKILSIYFPTQFLNIFSSKHLNYFINAFGLENTSRSEIDKQKVLLSFKDSDPVMKFWSIFEFSKFLYFSFGRPNDDETEKNLPNELKEFSLKDFPPIESVGFEFINLTTEPSEPNNREKKKKSKKIDHSKQSKRFKRIGDRGEQIVMKAEREFLKKIGKIELSNNIDQISKRDDSVGYDIVSFDLEGNTKLIEVKSTLRKVGFNNIFLSANELKVALSKENYFFYIVYDVGSKNPKIWKKKGSSFLNDKNIVKEPVLYRVNYNVK